MKLNDFTINKKLNGIEIIFDPPILHVYNEMYIPKEVLKLIQDETSYEYGYDKAKEDIYFLIANELNKTKDAKSFNEYEIAMLIKKISELIPNGK